MSICTDHSCSRRNFIYSGMGLLGLTMGDFFKLQAQESSIVKAQSVIHIFLPGGVSHIETWDPKPLAPIEYRGPLSTVKAANGALFSQYLQNTAKIADKITVIRSMTHNESAHERGVHNMFTGYRPSPAVQYPSFGSVVSHELGTRNNLPPYVCIPNVPNEFAGTGYLPSSCGAFSLGSEPSSKEFKVRDLNLGVSQGIFDRRRQMLNVVDEHFRTLEKSDALNAMDKFYSDAYNLISSNSAREAFNLNSESIATREMYGMSEAGQRMLMAKRLVKAGVRFVTLTYGGWDHHSNISKGIENALPVFDKAFAALITDLEREGMLQNTLVMVSSEFGRTPKINKDSGRDHHPKVFSTVLAGGGIKQGLVYGESDATGAEPANDPVTVENLAATVYSLIGINPEKKLMSAGNRPIDIVYNGKIISDII